MNDIKCDMDCFNCKFSDCVCNVAPTEEEVKKSNFMDEDICGVGIILFDSYSRREKISLEKYSVSDYNRAYYKANCELIKHNIKLKYDKEKNAERCKRYREKNQDKIKDYHKSYYQRNKEKLKEYAKNRYYKLKEV